MLQKLSLTSLPLTPETRVFIRVDFNVPLPITEKPARIVAAIPTIKYCMQKAGKVIIGSHLGRPDGQQKKEFSMEQVKEQVEKLLETKIGFVKEISRKAVDECPERR